MRTLLSLQTAGRELEDELLLKVLLCLLQFGLLIFGAVEPLCDPVCKLLRPLQLLGGWQRPTLLGKQLVELALDGGRVAERPEDDDLKACCRIHISYCSPLQ